MTNGFVGCGDLRPEAVDVGGEPALRNYEEFCSLLYAKIQGASAGSGWFTKDSASLSR